MIFNLGELEISKNEKVYSLALCGLDTGEFIGGLFSIAYYDGNWLFDFLYIAGIIRYIRKKKYYNRLAKVYELSKEKTELIRNNNAN